MNKTNHLNERRLARPGTALAAAAGALALATFPHAAFAADTIAWESANTGNGFYIAAQCGMIAAAKEAGVEIKYFGNTPFSAQAQLPVLNAIAATSPAALIVPTTDPQALDAPLREMKQNGTKIIAFDNAPADDSLYDGFVEANQVQGGVEAADRIGKLLDGKGKVLLIDLRPGVTAVNDHTKGFLEEIKKFPGITVLPTTYDQESADKDAQIVNATLAANPDLAAVVPMYNEAADGAIAALKGNDKLSQVKIVTFDGEPDLVNWVKDGTIDSFILNPPFSVSKKALAMALQALKGEAISPKVVQVDMPLVDKTNIDDPAVSAEFYRTTACNP
jgi:ribose transport system substrate-binding protein